MDENRLNPESPTRSPLTRRRAAVAAAALALAGTAGAIAVAEPVSNDIPTTCAIGTGTFDVTIPLTVDDKIDPVEESGQEILEVQTGSPSLPVEATINKLVVTMPIPEQIATVDAVTFTGGNVVGSYEIAGADIVVTFTGPVSSSQMDLPVLTADQTLKGGTAGSTIQWKTFSRVDADTNYGTASCTPNDPNQIVNTTAVVGGQVEPTPTTEPAGPSPTEPTPTTEPAGPAEPTPTTAPSGPTEPTPTTAPSGPTEPAEPTPTTEPAKPAKPAKPANGVKVEGNVEVEGSVPPPSAPVPPPTPSVPLPIPPAPTPVPVPTPGLPVPPPSVPTPSPGSEVEIGVEIEISLEAQLGF